MSRIVGQTTQNDEPFVTQSRSTIIAAAFPPPRPSAASPLRALGFGSASLTGRADHRHDASPNRFGHSFPRLDHQRQFGRLLSQKRQAIRQDKRRVVASLCVVAPLLNRPYGFLIGSRLVVI